MTGVSLQLQWPSDFKAPLRASQSRPQRLPEPVPPNSGCAIARLFGG